MSSYPKWLYHPTKEAQVVPDEAAHKALGSGWVESPADVPKPPASSLAATLVNPQAAAQAAHHPPAIPPPESPKDEKPPKSVK